MGVAGTTYSNAQLQQLWINAGGSSSLAPTMAAIAEAESSGGASSTNSNTNGTTDYGLWQINSVNGGNSSYFDPTVNAQAAVKIYQQQGLGAWTTYSSGAYQQYMSGGGPSSSGVPTSATGSPVSSTTPVGLTSDIGGAIGQGIGDAIMSIMKPFFEVVIWGVEAVGGIVLMGAAVFIMAQGSSAVRDAEGAAIGGAALSKGFSTPKVSEPMPEKPGPSKSSLSVKALASDGPKVVRRKGVPTKESDRKRWERIWGDEKHDQQLTAKKFLEGTPNKGENDFVRSLK